MKDNLNIYAKNNEFFIKTHHTDLADLRIIKGNNRILFDKSDYFTWKINGQDIASILDYENEDRAYIYYENEEQINATNFIVRYSDHCYVEINHKKIFCYVTLDKKIRFIWNQAPSIKAYYKSTTINNIYEKSDGILLEASVHSQFIPLTKAQLIVRNRQTKLEIPVENLCSTSLKKETNTFENKLQFKLEPNKIIPIIHPNINYNEYDTTILDFSIQLDSTKFPLTKIQYRVPYTENKATETWCSFSKEAMFLFSWYNTQNGYLSSRIGTLNRNEYSYYLDLCENDTIESEKKGNIVLVSEYPHKAQDNGFFFFKYLMEKQTKFEPYYVITTDSPDLINLKSYKNHVVFYKSKEHLKLLFTANYLIHSHSSNYVLPFYSETLLQEKVKMKKIFLQHGILYYRNMNYL